MRLSYENMNVDNAMNIYEKKIVQKYFNSWKIMAKIVKAYALAETKAIAYNSFCLKRKILKSLKMYCDRRKRKHKLHEKAWKYYKITVLKSLWMKWRTSAEEYANKTMAPQIRKALCFWRYKMIHKYFLFFKKNVEHLKRKRELKVRASNFHNLSIYRFCMAIWVDHYKEEQLEMWLERQAIAFHQVISLRNSITVWKMKYTCLYENLRQNEEALHYYESTIVSRCFMSWFQYTKYKVIMREKKRKAKAYYNYHLLNLCMSRWKLFVSENLKEKQKDRLFSRFYHRKIMSRSFNKWISYHQWHRNMKMRAVCLLQKKQCQEMLHVLNNWKEYVSMKKIMKNKLNIAVKHRNYRLLLKSFIVWKKFMQHRREKSARIDQMNQRMRNSPLCKGMMMFYFKEWYRQYEEVKKIYTECEEKLKRKYFLKWHLAYLEAVEKKAEKQKVEFQVKLMKMKWWFSIWHSTYQEKLQWKGKRMQALIHWSTTLKAKCMKTWHLYTVNQKVLLVSHKDFSSRKGDENLSQQMREMTAHESGIAFKYFRKWKLKIWLRKSCVIQSVHGLYDCSVINNLKSTKVSQTKSDQDLDNLCNYLLRKNIKRTVPRIPTFLQEASVQHFGSIENSCQCVYMKETEQWSEKKSTFPRHSKDSDYFYVPYKRCYHSRALQTLPESYSEDSLKSNDSTKTYRVNTPTYMTSTLSFQSYQDNYENLQYIEQGKFK